MKAHLANVSSLIDGERTAAGAPLDTSREGFVNAMPRAYGRTFLSEGDRELLHPRGDQGGTRREVRGP